MKVAVCITGQSRVRIGHKDLIKTLAHLNPVYFVHTWNEPPFSQWVIDAFKPEAYKLDEPDILRIFKQTLFNEYKALQSDQSIVEDRKQLLNGNKISSNYGCQIYYDAVLKMFYSMYAVNQLLIPYEFDYILKVRPDSRLLLHEPIPCELNDNQIICDARHAFGGDNGLGSSYIMSDQFFCGRANPMRRILNCWTSLAKLLHKEDHPKNVWLHPETTLRRHATECGIEVIGSKIRSDVHRTTLEGDPVGEWRLRPLPPMVQVQ